MSAQEIRAAMSALTHGVYVLGVHTPQKDNLMTAAWLCQVSGAPPTLAVAVSSKHLTAELIAQAKGFAVSVLAEDQRTAAMNNGRISGRVHDKLADTPVMIGADGHPLVQGAIAHLECRLVNTAAANDHTLFIGEVLRAQTYPGRPLTYREKEFF